MRMSMGVYVHVRIVHVKQIKPICHDRTYMSSGCEGGHLTGSFEKNHESNSGTNTVLNCFKMAARIAVVDCKPDITATTITSQSSRIRLRWVNCLLTT